MTRPSATTVPPLTRITDVHIHIQPWRELKPQVLEVLWHGKEAERDRLIQLMEDPRALLEVMDGAGVWRAGLVNYPSPDVMGFTDATNTFAATYARANPERLLPYGGVHPRFTRDPRGDVDRLIDLGIRLLKIHPPHQGFPANAYTAGLDALGAIYRRCEERGLPVMAHTGTSIFPGARSKFGNPMELDDVAIDFPDLPLVMAHGGRQDRKSTRLNSSHRTISYAVFCLKKKQKTKEPSHTQHKPTKTEGLRPPPQQRK